MATLRRRHFATLWRRFGDAWRRSATLGDAWRRLATLRAIGDARRRAATLWRQFGDSLATLWRRLATLGDAWSNLNNTGRERWLRKAAARSGRASIRPRVDPIESCSHHKFALIPRQWQNGRFARAGQALRGNGSLIEWFSHHYNSLDSARSSEERGENR